MKDTDLALELLKLGLVVADSCRRQGGFYLFNTFFALELLGLFDGACQIYHINLYVRNRGK